MLKALFSSKTRIELLKLFLLNPDASFYQREIEHKTGFPIRSIQKEIRNLYAIGLLSARASGNRTYYSLSKSHPLRIELKNIILKTSGIVYTLSDSLAKKKDIEIAFIYGSFAKDKESFLSDIDLFVIGGVSGRKFSAILNKQKSTLGREINFSLYPKDEFLKKLKQGNHFIASVLKDKKIFLIGNADDLKAIRA
jgi:predicted nucleotidyltransferase